jgi:SAM-dependent methyltransferase
MKRKKLRLGKIDRRAECRFCGSTDLYMFLDLGFMPHAGDFLTKKEVGKELCYPLKIYYCKKCGLVQILEVISSKTLFKNYHYLSSVSLTGHFKELAEELKNKFLNKKSFVVEIGSNDGVLLYPLKKMGFNVLGVDPAINVVKIAEKKGIETVTDFFGKKIAEKILAKKGGSDVILASNVLAHIDNMTDVFKGITTLLKPNGVLIFEVHYFPDLLKDIQYDFFYNEHLSYSSLKSLIPFLNKFNLQIFDVKHIKIHSGSIRVYAKFKDNKKYKIKKTVRTMYEKDLESLGFSRIKKFSSCVYKHREDLKNVLDKIKKDGNKIVGYGASGRANTLLNFCKIDNTILDYIVDDSPERQDKFTPGTHIPIVSPSVFRKDNVKYVLLLAWNYKDEIFKKERKFIKKGGKFIIPFPKVREV